MPTMPAMLHGADAVAEALAAACSDADVLARLGGRLGHAVRAAAAGGADRLTRARWAAAARTAVPAGLRGVHPSWIEAALVELPPRARAAVAAGGGDVVDVWLARWATAAIPAMPAPAMPAMVAPEARGVGSLDSALRVDAATLEGWLEDVGADQLAFSLAAAGAAAGAGALAAAAVQAGERQGERLRRAAEQIGKPPRAGALGPARAAIARCRVALDDRALVRIGARAIAPYVDGLARLRIMHRLRRPIGLVVGDELAAAAGAIAADAPRWDALGAPVQ